MRGNDKTNRKRIPKRDIVTFVRWQMAAGRQVHVPWLCIFILFISLMIFIIKAIVDEKDDIQIDRKLDTDNELIFTFQQMR